MERNLDEKSLFYDRFANDFDKKMSMYDTNRRLEVIFEELLTEDISGKALLDAGSGTGWFSKEAARRGARVVSLDVGENILAQVAKKCETTRVVGSVLDIPFPDNHFDIVMSTEVIEHTPDPRKAVSELHRVLRKGGVLVLTVPNRIWFPAVFIANVLKLRPYEGYENWVGWFQMKKWMRQSDLRIVEMKGVHLFPFVFPFTFRTLRFLDHFGRGLGPAMVNICVKAKK